MLYSVKTVYRTSVEAESPQAAYQQVYAQMKQEPGVFIAGVERYSGESRKHGIIYRLIFGY
jgi:hypothetical protein